MGRYRSAVLSLRMTTCWPLGMWTRMLSTCISVKPLRATQMILCRDDIFPAVAQELEGRRPCCHLESLGNEPTPAPPAGRQPLADIPRILRAAGADGPQGPPHERRIRLHVDAAQRPARDGPRGGGVRPPLEDVSPRGVRRVQGSAREG